MALRNMLAGAHASDPWPGMLHVHIQAFSGSVSRHADADASALAPAA
jgi:hypothetical protein